MGNRSSKQHQQKIIHFYYEGVKQDLKFYPKTDNLAIFRTLLVMLNVPIKDNIRQTLDYTIFQSNDGTPVVFDPNTWPSDFSVHIIFKNVILPQRIAFLWHTEKQTDIITETDIVLLLKQPFIKGIYKWTAQWEHSPLQKDFIGLVSYKTNRQTGQQQKVLQFKHGPNCRQCRHSKSYLFNDFKQERLHNFIFDVDKGQFTINGKTQIIKISFGLQLAVQKQTKGYLKLKWV